MAATGLQYIKNAFQDALTIDINYRMPFRWTAGRSIKLSWST
jgi:hypothetical protein